MNEQVILREINDSISVKRKILEDAELLHSIKKVANECIEAYTRGNRVLLAGNGGSAADAQHIAAEFVSRYAFDLSLIHISEPTRPTRASRMPSSA